MIFAAGVVPALPVGLPCIYLADLFGELAAFSFEFFP